MGCLPFKGVRPRPYDSSQIAEVEVRVLPSPEFTLVDEQINRSGTHGWVFLLSPLVGVLVDAGDRAGAKSNDEASAAGLAERRLDEIDPQSLLVDGLTRSLTTAGPGVFRVSGGQEAPGDDRLRDAVVTLSVKEWGVVRVAARERSNAIAYAVVHARMKDVRGRELWDETLSACGKEWVPFEDYQEMEGRLAEDVRGTFSELSGRVANTLIFQRGTTR